MLNRFLKIKKKKFNGISLELLKNMVNKRKRFNYVVKCRV
jgi:stalled ribosome rescue protein Dom34